MAANEAAVEHDARAEARAGRQHDQGGRALPQPEEVLADSTFPRVHVEVGGVMVPIPVPASAFGAPPVAERGPALGEHTDAVLGAL